MFTKASRRDCFLLLGFFLVLDVFCPQTIFVNARSRLWQQNGQWGYLSPSSAPTVAPSSVEHHKKIKRTKRKHKHADDEPRPKSEEASSPTVKKAKKHSKKASASRKHTGSAFVSSPTKDVTKSPEKRKMKKRPTSSRLQSENTSSKDSKTISKAKIHRKIKKAKRRDNGFTGTKSSLRNDLPRSALPTTYGPRKRTVKGVESRQVPPTATSNDLTPKLPYPSKASKKKKKARKKKSETSVSISSPKVDRLTGETTNHSYGRKKSAKKRRKATKRHASQDTKNTNPLDRSEEKALMGTSSTTATIAAPRSLATDADYEKTSTLAPDASDVLGRDDKTEADDAVQSIDDHGSFDALEVTESVKHVEEAAASTELPRTARTSTPADNEPCVKGRKDKELSIDDGGSFDALEITQPVKHVGEAATSTSLPPPAVTSTPNDNKSLVEEAKGTKQSIDDPESFDAIEVTESVDHVEEEASSTNLPATSVTSVPVGKESSVEETKDTPEASIDDPRSLDSIEVSGQAEQVEDDKATATAAASTPLPLTTTTSILAENSQVMLQSKDEGIVEDASNQSVKTIIEASTSDEELPEIIETGNPDLKSDSSNNQAVPDRISEARVVASEDDLAVEEARADVSKEKQEDEEAEGNDDEIISEESDLEMPPTSVSFDGHAGEETPDILKEKRVNEGLTADNESDEDTDEETSDDYDLENSKIRSVENEETTKAIKSVEQDTGLPSSSSHSAQSCTFSGQDVIETIPEASVDKESHGGDEDKSEDPYLEPDVVQFIGKVLNEDVEDVLAWTNAETSNTTDGGNTSSSRSLNETRGGSQVASTVTVNRDAGSSVHPDVHSTLLQSDEYGPLTESIANTSLVEVEVDAEMNQGDLKSSQSNFSGAERRQLDRRSLETSDDKKTDAIVSVVTWNLAEESPSEEDSEFIRAFRKAGVKKGSGSDLVLVSGQECENIKPRRTEGRRSREYRRLMIKMLGKDYVPIALHLLGGIQFGLFAKKSFLKEIEHVSIADVTCGIGNVFHNKGAIAAFLKVKARNPAKESSDTDAPRSKSLRMVFVTAHMAAHVKNSDARDADFWRISNELEAQAPEGFLPHQHIDGAADDRSFLFDSVDRAFFCGDLNYRIDLPREVTEYTILTGNQEVDWLNLMQHDQLFRTMTERRAFPGFAEGNIKFAPTFKFDKDTGDYDTSHKQRIPAWTDRILFKPWGTRVVSYDSVPGAQHSDHRPVHGTFRINMEGRELPPPKTRRKKQIKKKDSLE